VFGDVKDRTSLDAAARRSRRGHHDCKCCRCDRTRHIDSADLRGNRNLIDAERSTIPLYVRTRVWPDSPVPFTQAKGVTEEHLRASGMPFTIVAPNLFMEVWMGPADHRQPVSCWTARADCRQLSLQPGSGRGRTSDGRRHAIADRWIVAVHCRPARHHGGEGDWSGWTGRTDSPRSCSDTATAEKLMGPLCGVDSRASSELRTRPRSEGHSRRSGRSRYRPLFARPHHRSIVRAEKHVRNHAGLDPSPPCIAEAGSAALPSAIHVTLASLCLPIVNTMRTEYLLRHGHAAAQPQSTRNRQVADLTSRMLPCLGAQDAVGCKWRRTRCAREPTRRVSGVVWPATRMCSI
jgi:hypothetical protein